jgi:carbonic anhydrase
VERDSMKARALLAVVTLSSTSMVLAADHGAGHHWGYKGEAGPGHWAAMDKENATCGIGKTQSPIDIKSKSAKAGELPAIAFDYRASPLRIIDNGHTVQVNYAPGSSITVDGARYDLVQFHFHKPSEEKVDGKSFDMVAHLVHKDAQGRLAVVAVPLMRGKENAAIATLWKNLPHEKEHEAANDAVSINAADLLPAQRGYYSFQGSLTTPPCSEGVQWFVLKQPTSISGQEIAAFGKLYPMNARPVQALNGREIKATK